MALLSVGMPAQDMLAVDYAGQIYTLDSTTGQTSAVGIGMLGQNGMARDAAGRLWSTAALGGGSFYLTEIDPLGLSATPVHPTGDLRALAAGPGASIYGVESTPLGSQLVRIDSVTGQIDTVGGLGTFNVQAMTMHQGTLYAWDFAGGLLEVNQTTGNGRVVGSGPGNIQWLATRDDGQLVGGGADLRTIDPITGSMQVVASPIAYMRGAEASGYALSYGQGCHGGNGPVTLSVRGRPHPGGLLSTRSIGHASVPNHLNAVGALILGTSRTNYRSFTLPLSLDPFLGTSGCSLYASIDASLIAVTQSTSPQSLLFAVQIPASLRNATVYLQHAAFDPVQGGMSWSNGVEVRIGN